jgi:hypothetical protein
LVEESCGDINIEELIYISSEERKTLTDKHKSLFSGNYKEFFVYVNDFKNGSFLIILL